MQRSGWLVGAVAVACCALPALVASGLVGAALWRAGLGAGAFVAIGVGVGIWLSRRRARCAPASGQEQPFTTPSEEARKA